MTVKIKYLPSLGSFLDEKGIVWNANNLDEITIVIKDAIHAFNLGREYEKFMQEIEKE